MPPATDHSSRPLLSALAAWLDAGGTGIGEVTVRRESGGGYLLRHAADAGADAGTLTRHTHPEAAREVAKHDAAGTFRPLKTAPTLARGWELAVETLADLRLALDFLYPAALANWVRALAGEAKAPPLRETLGRQTGIYRVTSLIRDDEAGQLVAEVCGEKCLRHVLWPLDATQGWDTLSAEKQTLPPGTPAAGGPIPLLCLDPCPLLVGGARSIVKRRRKPEPEREATEA